MARFLLRELPDAGRVRLRGTELRHLRTVLRIGPGERVELFDGTGRSFLAEVRSVGATAAELEIVEELGRRSESPVEITLAVALAKGPRLDWTVEKVTELGVACVVPFTSERTVPVPGDFRPRLDRLRRIAAAASRQSGRNRCPEVGPLSSFGDVLALGERHDRRLLFDAGAGVEPPGGQAPRRVLAITGPEGGFSARELQQAEGSGFLRVGLGPRILRAETAPIVVAAICQWRWGDLGASGRG